MSFVSYQQLDDTASDEHEWLQRWDLRWERSVGDIQGQTLDKQPKPFLFLEKTFPYTTACTCDFLIIYIM